MRIWQSTMLLRRSIAARVLLATATVGLLMFAVSATSSYRHRRDSVQRALVETMHRISTSRARSISFWFQGRQLLVETANEGVARRLPGEPVEQAFKREALAQNFLGTYFGAADGSLHSYPRLRVMPAGYDPRNRPWYRQAAARHATTLTDPYRDPTLPHPVVTMATPQYADGRLIGVTAADFSLAALVQMLRESNPEGGYIFIVNQQGRILVHPNAAMVGKTLADVFVGRTPPISAAVTTVHDGRTEHSVTFAPIENLPGAKWYVGVSIDGRSAYGELATETWSTMLRTALVSGASLLIVWLVLAKIVLAPLRRMIAAMKTIASGCYDIEIVGADREDEIGAMARAIEVFRENGRSIAELNAAERVRLAQQAEDRALMMSDLQASFGKVVDAAIAGDFSPRVTERYTDAELNALARSVNQLVETIDLGLSETGSVLAALAETDLTRRVHRDFSGAFAALKTSTNAVADKLEDVIGQLRDTSRQLKTATHDLSAETAELSQRTADQADAIVATSDAIQRLTEKVAENAASAQVASHRAQEAAGSAQESSAVLAGALATMERLNASSATVSSIIGMIDSVASQTALVALNATIEAARAGEAGRGFAVVATEVKTLAGQAASASSEARRLIDRTAGEVAAGSALMAEMMGSLSAMLRAVHDNNTHLGTIADASAEQTASISRISAAIDKIEGITRHNADLVRELNATTRDTESRASELDGIVDVFTLRRERQ
ncbi:methyl-accepting chemotaxis protein [Sphingomonas quercus]|uniref:Methyl-accepting chemotaxis protein n=1 Tax=Sphingomonas quercus TaxID=2842451 RepID=A0ABS6BGQ3_9SPHN|nr:methyl-accepting chemotaxis protein [Sphingomonas quercus]MBU3077474.1 methyl-accepting chemotaxis protein [Sphingomonas quercus]